jgi:hypothetical protein
MMPLTALRHSMTITSLLGLFVIGCTATEPVPTPTPEVQSILATVEASKYVPLPTQTVVPSPTPESPGIFSTIQVLLATPTATPLPTNTPGPTPTPRSTEISSITVRTSGFGTIPVKLEAGERIEGYILAGSGGLQRFSIQSPEGKVLHDSGSAASANFYVTADLAGWYALEFSVPEFVDGRTNLNIVIEYRYDVIGSS